MDAPTHYARGRGTRTAEVAALDARSRALGWARLGLVVLALLLLGEVVWGPLGATGGWALGAVAASFFALVVVHGRVIAARDRAAAALRFHERGLARLARDWKSLPDKSARYLSADHPFAADLDIFGQGSLMQLVDATETGPGEDHLARLLSMPDAGAWPQEASERQLAVRDLAARAPFREAIAVAGAVLAEDKPDPAALVSWAEATDIIPPWLAVAAWIAPVTFAAVVVGGATGFVPGRVEGLTVFALVAFGLVAGGRLAPLLSMASTREQSVSRWRGMIEAIEQEPFEAPRLAKLRGRLSAPGGRSASAEIAALERVVGFTDALRNEVFRFLIAPLLMWDVHCASALLRWRTRAGPSVRGWLEALGEVEALASLGGFAFEHPAYVWPELVPEPGLVARGLAHPLLPDDRSVGNDVTLQAAGRALVVTGSNMSGKSTLLRAIGLGAVLAHAGAPVSARSARLGPSRVATSMRIEDSLEDGVSHFYAELRRLKSVLDRARDPHPAPVLFLLDEILHGTNSRERIVGACAVVRTLVARGALGAVSTHDLGITALETELAGSVENVHFEEQVRGDQMTFDYVLRPGVVQSSNALRLMRAVGIDVPDPGA